MDSEVPAVPSGEDILKGSDISKPSNSPLREIIIIPPPPDFSCHIFTLK